ncbi:MAG: AsmA family protein [Nitrospiraceae bacterium]|nr:AsmA family protein [Nitrospiraceae bacterium]
MKKFLWITGVVLAAIIVVVAGLSLFVNTYFRGERLKAMVLPRIEHATGRKASIENISISIFRGGVVLSNMALARRSGKGNFISAKEFVLKYRFWPLLRRQLVINSIYLDSPYIFIERKKDGAYNFSDIKRRLGAKKTGAPEAKKKKTFQVAISRITIKNATARFVDDTGALPAAQALADMDFDLATGPAGQPAVSGEIDLKALKAKLKTVQADVAGKIKIAGQIKIALDASLDKDSIKLSGSVNNYLTAPSVTLDVSSKRLDLGTFMAALPQKKKARAPKRPVAARPKPATKLSATGRITVATALYKNYVIKGLSMDYRYSGGVFSVNPFRATVTGGDKVIVDGNVLGSIGFGPGVIKDTLRGKGRARFSKIIVRQSSIARQIAVLLGMPELSTPSFNDSLMNYAIKNGRTFLDGYFNSAALEFNPVKGSIGREKQLDVALDLQLSPALSGGIGRKYLNFLANKKGWTVIPMKINGTTRKPHVGISTAAGKAVEKRIGGEMEKQLQRLFR